MTNRSRVYDGAWRFVRGVGRRVASRALSQRFAAVICDPSTLRFMRHNVHAWSDWKVAAPEAEVLVDLHAIGETHIPYSYLANLLARKHRARINVFSYGSALPQRRLWRLYRSFNAQQYIRVRGGGSRTAVDDALLQCRNRIQNRQDLLQLTVNGVWLGIDVYESYLRRFCLATVDLSDTRLWDVLREAIEALHFWRDYLDCHRVTSVLVSHDCYIEHNVLAKLAYARRIPVYLPFMQGITRADQPFSTALRFADYPALFASLPLEEQREGLAIAKRQLAKRLSGELDPDMSYITESPFERDGDSGPVLEKTDRFRVLVATHCFHDNPHAYGPLPFTDFVEWLRYLGAIAERTNYDWYVKMHRGAIPGTEDVIRGIMREFPRLRWVSPDVSHHQLVADGINCVLTIYGSVGHEYPMLGVPVVNAAYNPHSGYGFNHHARSLAEYERYLLNLPAMHVRINEDEVHEFYYMNYYYTPVDDLFVPSYRDYVRDMEPQKRYGHGSYEYFLDRLTDERHDTIVRRIQEFIDSDKRELFSRGPVLPISREESAGAGRPHDPGVVLGLELSRS